VTASARRLQVHSRRAILHRARTLAQLSRAPAAHIARHRRHLHQLVRELRASARRDLADGHGLAAVHMKVLGRKAAVGRLERARGLVVVRERLAALRRSSQAAAAKRDRDLERMRLALAAHDPERALERGYALVQDRAGEPLTTAAAAREAGGVELRFHDGAVPAVITGDEVS
jgi:exodeoxyribonuclease VII large subunit